MLYLLNLIYVAVIVLVSPWLLYKACTAGKYRRGLLMKLFGWVPGRRLGRPCVWFHGVSVGEVHLLRQVVREFRRQFPGYEVVVSSTTDTGLEEARKHFADLSVFYWPLDFTWAIKRALARIQPELVVLAESEIWPNFLRLATKAGIKTAVINGRMSPRSSHRYEHFGFLLRPVLRNVDLWLMQNQEYAEAVRGLVAANPVERNHVHVTGNVKYDGVEVERGNAETRAIGELLGCRKGDLVLVTGSTQAPEEETVLGIYGRLRVRFPALRLIVVPRQQDRFDEVAQLLQTAQVPFIRWTELTAPVQDRQAVILVDTIGKLRAIWGLADVAYVGGSLDGKRGGQNMIEPAAYGAAVLFGPHVWNFKDTVARLLARDAAVQVADARELEREIMRFLAEPERRDRFGTRAQQFVQSQQGATARTVALLGELLTTSSQSLAA